MRAIGLLGFLFAMLLAPSAWGQLSGEYFEIRTCDIYTGPCFANAEVGLTGKDALMAWSIEKGAFQGVDLAGLKVIAVISASGTLGYGGGVVVNPEPIRSVVLVDAEATPEQQQALVAMVRARAGRVLGEVVRVMQAPIEMKLDHVDMVAYVKAGRMVHALTRKLCDADHVCTNEVIFYPPLAPVDNAAPAVVVSGGYRGRGLGVQWELNGSRSAFLATFQYE